MRTSSVFIEKKDMEDDDFRERYVDHQEQSNKKEKMLDVTGCKGLINTQSWLRSIPKYTGQQGRK